MQSQEIYLSLMKTIRGRLDVIEALKISPIDEFPRAESAAFHGRKIVEAIAFACLVAIENKLKTIPRDAKGQWNAESIFNSLKKKGLTVLPSPSIIRQTTEEEIKISNIKTVIEGQPERRLTHEQLIDIYKRLHAWLYEVNPYIHKDHFSFCSRKASELWDDLSKLALFIDKHFISIQGSGFFCVLRDNQDQQTKVIPLNKEVV